jgi:hypothetical protein
MLKTPIPWNSPESLANPYGTHQIATAKGDMYMLGGLLLELVMACTRQPFDWLNGTALKTFRHNDTRSIDTLQVRCE